MAENRTEELRGNVTPKAIQLIDACARAKGMSRTEWAEPHLIAAAEKEIHSAMLLCRMVGVNPTDSEGRSK